MTQNSSEFDTKTALNSRDEKLQEYCLSTEKLPVKKNVSSKPKYAYVGSTLRTRSRECTIISDKLLLCPDADDS
jgi:hypothetical protein